MGDENSLQGRTQAHKHESASSTGGFLETGLTGMTNLSNGSLIMGDATEIQTELSAGNLNDVLTMGASVPSWVAPASVSSTWTTLYDSTLVGTGTVSSGTFVAHDVLAVYIFAQLSSSGNQAVTFNNTGAGSGQYTETHSLDFGSAVTGTGLNSIMYQSPSGTAGSGWSMATLFIMNHASEEKNVYFTNTEKQATGNSAPRMWSGGGCWINTANQITRIDLANDSGAQVDYTSGTQMVILGSS